MKKKLIRNRHGNHGSTGKKCIRKPDGTVIRVPFIIAQGMVEYGDGVYVPKSEYKKGKLV